MNESEINEVLRDILQSLQALKEGMQGVLDEVRAQPQEKNTEAIAGVLQRMREEAQEVQEKLDKIKPLAPGRYKEEITRAQDDIDACKPLLQRGLES